MEVLGKHTDYAGGRSLVAAVDRGFFCVAARNGSNLIRMVQTGDPQPCLELELSAQAIATPGHWSIYPATMVRRLAANFPQALEEGAGVDVAFGCDLPPAGGMSGSSALMIMTFLALALPNRLQEAPPFKEAIKDGLGLAMYLACVENGQTFRGLRGNAGVGTFGGSEDHTAIMNAEPGRLSLFRFCPTEFEESIPLPDSLSMIIAHSGVRAEKTGGARDDFNRVSQRARLVVDHLNRHWGTRYALMRDIIAEQGRTPERLMATVQEALRPTDPALNLFARFVQFYEEDQVLIPGAATALKTQDCKTLGTIISRSHELSRTHLRNILPEIDYLQQSALSLGAVAASGFGAGFGGSVYALTAARDQNAFLRSWRESYLRTFPQYCSACDFFPTSLCGKAGELFA